MRVTRIACCRRRQRRKRKFVGGCKTMEPSFGHREVFAGPPARVKSAVVARFIALILTAADAFLWSH